MHEYLHVYLCNMADHAVVDAESAKEEFEGKSCQFVGEWLAKKNLEKLKNVFEGKIDHFLLNILYNIGKYLHIFTYF